MKRQWQYLLNQFLNSTVDNYKKAIKLSNYHDADLNAKKGTEPLLIPIYERYHEKHLVLITEYNAWKSASGNQEGKTAALKQLLDSTYGNMNAWDVQVQVTFLKGTPQYISIFPNGRKPFTEGSVDDRINAYSTLALNMEPYAALNALRTTVTNAYTALDTARDEQEGSKGTLKTDSGKVEAARIDAMTMQYRDLGFAIDNFYDQPEYIASMFDLTTLREGEQTQFTGTLNPMETKDVATRTLYPDYELRAKSNGNAIIRIYLASTPGGTNSSAIEVPPNEEKTFTASEFGIDDYATHRYITVVNQSVSETTQYIIDLE